MGHVYQPSEDSYLLAKHVEDRLTGYILDMGTGSGIQAITAAKKPEVEHVTAVDIDPYSLECARRNAEEAGMSEKITFLRSDLFESVEGEFDWIVFNPPYLPSDGRASESSWCGGEKGFEVIHRFLSDAPSHLKTGGAILLVYSDKTGLDLNLYTDYVWEVLEEKKLFFEIIYCALLYLSPS